MFSLPSILQNELAVFFLVFFRLTGLFILAPFFSGSAVPQRLKVFLALGISVCVSPMLFNQGDLALKVMQDPVFATVTVLGELALGLVVGLIVSVVVASVQTAGQFIANDVGMTIANIIDPLSNRQISILSQLVSTLSIVIFIVLDYHHKMIQLLVKSFQFIPVGTITKTTTSTLFSNHLQRVVAEEGKFLFSGAMQIALPVTVTLVVVTVAMAFLARSVPEINVFIIGFTIRILVGFFVIVLMLPFLREVYEGMFNRAIQNSWEFIRGISTG